MALLPTLAHVWTNTMNNRFEVTFTVYEDRSHSSYQSNLHMVTTTVEAFMPQQAQALVEAQYGGLAHVWSVHQTN